MVPPLRGSEAQPVKRKWRWRRQKSRRSLERSCLPTALSLPIRPNGNVGTFRLRQLTSQTTPITVLTEERLEGNAGSTADSRSTHEAPSRSTRPRQGPSTDWILRRAGLAPRACTETNTRIGTEALHGLNVGIAG